MPDQNEEFRSRVLSSLDEIKTDVRSLTSEVRDHRDDQHELDKRVVKLETWEEQQKQNKKPSRAQMARDVAVPAGGIGGLLAFFHEYFPWMFGSGQ